MTELATFIVELRRAISAGELALAEEIASQLADDFDLEVDDRVENHVGIWGADG